MTDWISKIYEITKQGNSNKELVVRIPNNIDRCLSLGFDPENLPKLFNSKDLQITRWGTLKTNFDTMETNLPGVFAAGDIIRGASLVVWAIKDGRDAAISISKYLKSQNEKNKKVA
jgi:glutamate synthase (NADPH/NADH) small chain